MSPTRKFAFKLAFYGVFLLYLVGDLFVWNGFLSNKITSYLKPIPGPPGDNSARIAEIYGEPITANQLSRRVTELQILRKPPVLDMNGGMRLIQEQDISGDLTPRAKYDLIASSLLRLKSSVNDLQLPNRHAEAIRTEEQLQSRFNGNAEQYLKSLHDQKSTREQFHKKIEARLKQTEQLYRATAQVAEPSEEELKTYYNLIREQLASPDLRKIRHIFLATLHKDEKQVQLTAEALLARLNAGESFHKLAKEFSEDERSACSGGELGWINPAKAQKILGLNLTNIIDNKPVLVKSNWGWHLIEASPVKKGKIPTYEEALPALKNAARNLRKSQAIGLYMDSLFEDAHLKSRIKNK